MADETVVNRVEDGQTVDIEDQNVADPKETLLMEKIAVLKQEKLQLIHENEVINERVGKLQRGIQDAESSNVEMKKVIEKSQFDNNVLEADASRAAQLETEISRLQLDLIKSKNDVQDANYELSALKSEISDLKKKESETSFSLAALVQERDLLVEKIAALETKEGSHEKDLLLLEEYKKRVAEKDGEIVTLKTLVGKLENMVKEDRLELERGKKERDELEIEKNELEALLKKSERKVKEMESKLGALEGLENGESLNGRGMMVDGHAVGEKEKRSMSLIVQWPIVVGSASAVAVVSVLGVLCLRHTRQK